jgi:hypothetical protein
MITIGSKVIVDDSQEVIVEKIYLDDETQEFMLGYMQDGNIELRFFHEVTPVE